MNKSIFLIILALSLGLLVRLYALSSPIADWHSFRQVDTASVTRNFLKNGLNLFIPTYHDLSAHQSGIDNPQGFRMVEFPLYNFFVYLIVKISSINLEIASRLTSIVLNLSTGLLLFFIVKSITRLFWPAYFSFIVFLFLPFNIFFSRTILPENTAVFFMILGLFLFPKNRLISAIVLSLSALVKPFTLILIFPILLFYFQKQNNRFSPKNLLSWFTFICVTTAPLLLWRQHIAQYPAGIPASNWLLNSTDTRIFPEWYKGFHTDFLNDLIILRPYWWRWLIFERLANLLMGIFGLIFFFLGFVYRKNQINLFNFLSLVGIFLYFLLVPGGNIQHDYYQILIIPSLSFTLGCGIYYLLKFTFKSTLISLISIFIISFLSLFYSLNKILPYYQINHPEIVEAGQYVDKLTPQNSLIIAPYNGDTALLYQTNRSGFPIEIYDIEKLKLKFPQNPFYLITLNQDEYFNKIKNLYPILLNNPKYVIFDLNHEIKL